MKTLHYIFYFALFVTVNPQRIGEGQNVTDPTMFPFHAMFIGTLNIVNGLASASVCGSSLIHPQWILTAGHCIPSSKSSIDELIRSNQDMIFMGSVYTPKITDDGIKSHGEGRKIVEVHRHPNYISEPFPDNPSSIKRLLNDIALLKLDKPFMLSDCVQVVILSTSFRKCDYGILIGIGDTDYNDPKKKTHILKYAKLEIKGSDSSKSKTTFYVSSEVNKVYDYNSSGYGLPGDSGAPFICDKTFLPLQIGVNSGGRYDNKTNTMINLMERIDYFIDFIKQHLPKDRYTEYLEKPRKEGSIRKEPNNAKKYSGTLFVLIFLPPCSVMLVYWLEK